MSVQYLFPGILHSVLENYKCGEDFSLLLLLMTQLIQSLTSVFFFPLLCSLEAKGKGEKERIYPLYPLECSFPENSKER